MIRWCTVPEIRCVTDKIVISYFGLSFVLLPPNSPKTQNFEKMKKTPGDIIILHMGTKNYDQMMYASWDMVPDGCNYFSFLAIFYLFTPLTAWKIKILKKWKKCLEISFYICVPRIMIWWCMVLEICCLTYVIVISHFGLFFALLPNSPKNQDFEKWKKHLEISLFYICVPKIMIRWCMVPEIRCEGCNYFSFWAIFCLFTPLTAPKIKILKKWKKHLEISSFYIWVPKIMIRWCTIPEICRATDEQMDGKSDI